MTTGSLCRRLGITPAMLRGALASRKVAEPPRDETGRFVWSEVDADVEAVRQAVALDLRRKPALVGSHGPA